MCAAVLLCAAAAVLCCCVSLLLPPAAATWRLAYAGIMQPPCGEPRYFAVSNCLAHRHPALDVWCGVCRQPCHECVHCIRYCVLLQPCRAVVGERMCAAATLACSARVQQVTDILGGGMATKHSHRVVSDCRAVCSTGATAIVASTSVPAADSLAVCPAEHIFFFFLQQSYLVRQWGPCFFGYMPLLCHLFWSSQQYTSFCSAKIAA